MATLTGQNINARYGDLLQVSNTNNGVDGTIRRVSDGLATDSALSLSTEKAQIDGVLNDASGDEAALTLNVTVNKASSGVASVVRANVTDTASPDIVPFYEGYRGANREILVNSGANDYPGFTAKSYNASAGWAHVSAEHNTGSIFASVIANGNAAAGALEAQDMGIWYAGNASKGFKVLTNQLGGYSYGIFVAGAVRLAEFGGSHAVDAGVRRSAAGLVQVFNGSVGSPSNASLCADGLTLGGTTKTAEGKLVTGAALNDATGDEYAFDQTWTINKATSGETYGIRQTLIDTASPGLSYFLSGRVGTGVDRRYFITQDGAFYLSGPTKFNTFYVEPEGNRVQLDKDTAFGWTNYGGDASELFYAGFAKATGLSVVRTRGATASDYCGLMLDANCTQYADTVTVSDGVATDIFDVALATGAFCGGMIVYTITATDGTDFQAHSGAVAFSAVNKAGAITATINEGVTEAIATTTGSLTDTWTAVDGTGKVTVRCSANSSLTTPTMTLRYQLLLNHSGALTKK